MYNELEYKKEIIEIPLYRIELNELNPRKKFVENEEDELINSINSKGILTPIIVYKKSHDNNYVLLDGERRYRACRKLNFKTIPAYILKHEPSVLDNLSLMFHIHNVREEWTDFAISISLKKVVDELGKNIRNLNRYDVLELSSITSLYSLSPVLEAGDLCNILLKTVR